MLDAKVEEDKFGLKAWAQEDRPREKLMLHGRRHLTDSELMSILIGSGSADETAPELSKRILSCFNNDLVRLGNATFKTLSGFKGIGQVKALKIVAALELGRRRKEINSLALENLKASGDAYNYLLPLFADLNHEEFWIVLLNRANAIISRHLISVGGRSGTIADPKIIFKIAIENEAAYIILAHNHPSGQLHPSHQDISLTKKLVEAGKLLDLRVYDHLIITNMSYFSFADEGLI